MIKHVYVFFILSCLNVFTITSHGLESENTTIESTWLTFKEKFKKIYNSDADEERHRIQFLKNLVTVNNHNIVGNSSFILAVNKFSDYSFDDVKKHFSFNQKLFLQPTHGNKCGGVLPNHVQVLKHIVNNINFLPPGLDWRDYGAVSSVKDQGTCGSCWAFSIVGVLEGVHAIKYGHMNELSEQFLIDCMSYEDDGCDGGYLDYVFGLIVEDKIWPPERLDYPNTGNSNRCDNDVYRKIKNRKGKPSCSSFYQFENEDEEFIMKLVALVGPVSAAVEVTEEMLLYKGGIIFAPNQDVNHAVIIVGYGVDADSGLKYWLIKNSWGEDWGENGYMRVLRGSNSFGISSHILFPLLDV